MIYAIIYERNNNARIYFYYVTWRLASQATLDRRKKTPSNLAPVSRPSTSCSINNTWAIRVLTITSLQAFDYRLLNKTIQINVGDY